MRRRLLALMLALVLALPPASPLEAQGLRPVRQVPAAAWEWAGIEDSGFNLDVFVHPSGVLFRRAPGALFRSDDDGTTWHVLQSPPAAPRPRNTPSAGGILVVHPGSSEIMYANGVGGIYRTSDGGTSWDLTLPREGEAFTGIVAISPADGARIYRSIHAGPDGREASLARSYDGGATWEALPPQPVGMACQFAPRLHLHPTDPDRLMAVSICETGRDRIWQSRDAGISWSVMFQSDEPPDGLAYPITITMAPGSASGRLYLAVNHHRGPARPPFGVAARVFRSDDDGTTWTHRATFEPRPGDSERTSTRIHDLVVDPSSSDRLFLALETADAQRPEESRQISGVKVSEDGGATWADLGNPAASAPERISRLMADTNGRFLFAASSHGIWRLPLGPRPGTE